MKVQQATLGTFLSVGLSMAAGHARIVAQAPPISNVHVTVVGCLQRSATQSEETKGTTVVPAGGTRYVLSNITLVPPEDRAGAADRNPTANALAESVKLYQVDDASAPLVASHVGDRVEISGTVVARPPSPTGTAGRPDAPESYAKSAPMLRVESLKTISSESGACSR